MIYVVEGWKVSCERRLCGLMRCWVWQSLRSCSLLRDPDAIAELCENLRQAFRAVQRALDETPTDFIIDGSDAKQNWYTKHWETVDSLNK